MEDKRNSPQGFGYSQPNTQPQVGQNPPRCFWMPYECRVWNWPEHVALVRNPGCDTFINELAFAEAEHAEFVGQW